MSYSLPRQQDRSRRPHLTIVASAAALVASAPYVLAAPALAIGRTSIAGPAGARPPATAPAGSPTPPTGDQGAPPRAPRAPAPPPAQPPVTVPAAVTAALVDVLGAGERQLASVDAYAEGLAYLHQARHRAVAATNALRRAVTALAADRREEARAVAAEVVARGRVDLYTRALCELGVAEYTDQGMALGTDLRAQERQMDLAQLDDVAAADTSARLEQALRELAAARAWVARARATVLLQTRATDRARDRLGAALAQVARSRKAAAAARTWATVPGAAPASPEVALARLQRPAVARARAAGPTGGRAVPSSRGPVLTLEGPVAAGPPGPAIVGRPLLTAAQLSAWFLSTGDRPDISVPLARLARDYMVAGRATGVRADIAFAQSMVETGYLSFPGFGQDPASYNNFAGIGACDTCKHGWKFPTAMAGVLVQLHLLQQYATPGVPAKGPVLASRGFFGCCRTWMALSGKWASNPAYGYEILSVYDQMLSWVLGAELQKVGLTALVPVGQNVPPSVG